MDALFSCFKEAIGVLKRRKVWWISFGTTILLGIILGLVLPKPVAIRQYYATYCRTYVDEIFAASVIKLFLKRLLAATLLLLLVVPLYFTAYYLPAAFLIVFFKGYTFGIVTVVLLSSFGVNGFFIFLICMLPSAILMFALLVVACVLGFDTSKKRVPVCGSFGALRWFLLLFVGVIACALTETLLVAVIFRPISKIF